MAGYDQDRDTLVLCPAPAWPEWSVDCNNDDYWNPFAPYTIRSWDNSHDIWNTANSDFLTDPVPEALGLGGD